MISPIVKHRMADLNKRAKRLVILPILAITINAIVLYHLLPDSLLNFSQSLMLENLIVFAVALAVLVIAFAYYAFINSSVKLYCQSNDTITSFLSQPILKLDYINLPQKERILIFSLYKYLSYYLRLQFIIIVIIELGLISALIYQNAANLYIYVILAFFAIKNFPPKFEKLIFKLDRKAYLHTN